MAGTPISYYANDAMNAAGGGFSADPSGGGDSTEAIQAALTAAANAGGGIVYLPSGTYKISEPLTIGTGVSLIGAGVTATVIKQASTTADGIDGTDVANVTLTGFTLTGPSSGSGVGINFKYSSNTNVPYLDFSDLLVNHWGSHGVELKSPIVSRFARIVSAQNGTDGFHLYQAPTSCTFEACYANDNSGGIGFHLISAAYCSLRGCAADSNADGYELTTCTSVSLAGCGAEASTTTGFILSGGSGNTLVSCFTYDSNGISISLVSGEAGATIIGAVEHSPGGGATAFIETASGTSCVVINDTHTTANSFASGTAYEILYSGGTTH